jgi:tetratricopeptide (TPR) repeat protein
MNRHRQDRSRSPAPRTEPVLGSLETLSQDTPRERVVPPRRAAPERRRSTRGWGWLVALVLLCGAGAWAWSDRDTLRALLPSTQLNDILTRADQALSAGRLDGSDGSSARELYSAARALAPDNERALGGLQQVGQAELKKAQAAFEAGRLDDAGHALEQARALLGGGSELDALANSIAAARARGTQLASLVDRARQALADGHIDGKDGAAALYQQILSADPGNAIAKHGLDRIGSDLAAQIRKALAANDLAGAQDHVQQLADLLPDYGDLPGLRAAVAQAQSQADAKRTDLLKQAAEDLAAGRVDGSGDDNALARYRAVLAIDADDADAHAGLQHVAAALLVRANASIDSGRADEAARLLDEASKLAPDSPDLAAARTRLRNAASTQTHDDDTAAPPPPPQLSADQRAKVQALITRAQAAAASGDLMLPPANSAYDLYRSALVIDPNNGDALAGLATLPAAARRLFDTAIGQGKPGHAADLMATFAELAPGSAALPAMRGKLATAWLDRASKRADMGDLGEARRALGEARRLAPDDPRISAIAQRLGG